ncbi:MAG: helix-turn-helix transcriptional regulator [Desulfuromonadales bacterium]|nr:helix-turn-helix transcriptional regulator [Desulfuromonadales bacterium]MBN2793671.1 helix-turn-helix transcriptional regulator [Desulfuromonadales bacterium]
MTARGDSISHDQDYGRISSVADIGRLVRLKRKQLGVLQEDAAGLSAVGTKFLSQLENGKESAEIGLVLQVLKSMGLEVYIYPRGNDPLKRR